MKRFSSIFALLLSLLVIPVGAQVITAASCSQSDVNTAFAAVTNSTTTVKIPACTGTGWSGQSVLTIGSGNTANPFFLQCAGSLTTVGGGDVTVIQDNDTTDENPILVVNDSVTNGFLRIAGCTVEDGTGTSQPKFNGEVQINMTSPNIRVDHSHFNTSNSGGSMIQWQGCAYGVIDHSIFDGSGVTNAVRAYNSGTCNGDSLGVGDQSWTQADGFGGPNFLFMENDVFNSGASNDCTKGGRFVSRFNTLNMTTPAPSIQTHPTGGGGRERGCRAQEDYEDQFNAQSSNYIDAAIWISSGTAMIWGNTTTSSSAGGGTGYHNFMDVLNLRASNGTYTQGTPPAGWGYYGTAQTGSASNWDQNQNSSGYRGLDSPGVGAGDLLTGGFTFDGSGSNNVTNAATGCISSSACAWPRQVLDPIYEWLDNYAPVPSNPSIYYANQVPGSTQNVDYYLDCRSGTNSGCTTFTGASTPGSSTVGGVGSGLKAARPSTCTTGVGYWATDEGTWNQSGSGPQGNLYICTATNTWTLSYTPYTYPHPLVSGGSPGVPATLTLSGGVKLSGNVVIQ